MNESESVSENVARWLRRAGVNDLVASILEAVGPLTYLGAQVAFLVEPLFGGPDGRIRDFARLLEDPDQVADLVTRLRVEGEQ
ncbi:MAG: hypothetical protein GTO14_16715 [Anaerolineales bacterium]|nr:hypothetical protein [Anaerolineales bacterium]